MKTLKELALIAAGTTFVVTAVIAAALLKLHDKLSDGTSYALITLAVLGYINILKAWLS